jgi:hypothetical protein
MRRRARNNGGTLQITTPDGGGTRLTWTAHPVSELFRLSHQWDGRACPAGS